MNFKRSVALSLVSLVLCTLCGCSGNGTGTPAATYKMTDVQPPANSGTEGGFIYATQKTVDVDISLPFPNGIVTIYDKRPESSPGTPPAALNVTAPAELARGASSAAADPADNLYHFRTAVTVPAAAVSVYVVPMMGLFPSTAVVTISGTRAAAVFARSTAGGN